MFYLYHNNINNIQNALADTKNLGDKFFNSKILHCLVEIAKRNILYIYIFLAILKNR